MIITCDLNHIKGETLTYAWYLTSRTIVLCIPENKHCLVNVCLLLMLLSTMSSHKNCQIQILSLWICLSSFFSHREQCYKSSWVWNQISNSECFDFIISKVMLFLNRSFCLFTFIVELLYWMVWSKWCFDQNCLKLI